MTAMAGTTSTQKLTKEMMVLVHSLVSFKASTSLKWGKRLTRRCFPIYFPAEFFRRSLLVYFSSLQKKAKRQQTWKGNEMKGVDWWAQRERDVEKMLGNIMEHLTSAPAKPQWNSNRRRARPVNASNRHGDGRWHVTSPSVTGDRIMIAVCFL